MARRKNTAKVVALDTKHEAGAASNRYAVPASLIRGPDISEIRTVSQFGGSPADQLAPRWIGRASENGP